MSLLEVGADDYITKPFSPRELIARINNILRRGVLISTSQKINIADLKIDVGKKTVAIKGNPVTLTANEYQLLHFFVTHPGRVYSRAQLLEHVWPTQLDITERAVDTQVRRLRDRLKPHQCHHLIQTVRGSGYCFASDKK